MRRVVEQIQTFPSSKPLFATDVTEAGAKVFYTCDNYETFCIEYYPKLREKHEYEVLRWDRPTKIYFDLDCSVETMTLKEFEGGRTELIDAVNQTCMDLFEEEPSVVYVLESSTDKKLSSHLIFDFVLVNMECVKSFVSILACQFPKLIDMSVYTRNRCFRILGSSKLGKTNVLHGHDTLFPTLVQGVLPESYHGLLHYIGRPVSAFQFAITQDDSTLHQQNPHRAPAKLIDFIKNVMRARIRPNGKEDDRKYSFLVHGMYCPFAKKVHKSNNSFFNIQKETMDGYFMCSDTDCPKIQFWNMNFLFCYL